LFDDATLAQLQGDHSRLRSSVAGERYVAGLDLAGPDVNGRGAAGTTGGDRDWTVLTIARVRPGVRREVAGVGSGPNGLGDPGSLPTSLAHVEIVEHQAWQGA